jgi:hypothetical protein
MSGILHHSRRFLRDDQDGAVLVEFAVVATVFFFGMFAVIDFARFAYTHVGTESAMRIAARMAVVRPPVCQGVPERITARGTVPNGVDPPRFGTSCKAANYVCAAPATVSCRGASDGNPNTTNTAEEIWARIQPLLPAGGTAAETATIQSLKFTYEYDRNLGYLGGPYVPMVTVELYQPPSLTGGQDVPIAFSFVVPLVNSAGALVGDASQSPFSLPNYSVSLPAEDLAQGQNG